MRHTLLLTGATGALGQPLLELLSQHAGIEKIYAFTHRSLLADPPAGVEVLSGDITASASLGLPPLRAEEISAEVTAILHAAAETRFSVSREQARRINLQGTKHVLAFAARCPRLDRLCHLSTLCVAGKRTGRILERDLHHTTGFINAYEESKYEAEFAVRACKESLPVAVARLSTVLGEARTGEVSRLGALHHALRLFYHSLAPMLPGRPDSPVDLISSDYAAAAVACLLCERFQPGKTYHICAGSDALPLEELLELTFEAFLRYRPAWRKRAIARPAIVELATFELFVRSVEEIGDPPLRQCVDAIRYFAPQLAFPKKFDDTECQAAMALGGVRRPALREFYPRVLRFLIENNWQAAGALAREEVTA